MSTITYFPPANGGAPASAPYITQTPDGSLTAEQALSTLATGLLKSTTATGIVSIAVAADVLATTGTYRDTSGANLADADATITPGTSKAGRYIMPAGTTTAVRTITLGIGGATTRQVSHMIIEAQGNNVVFKDDLAATLYTATAGSDIVDIQMFFFGGHWTLSSFEYVQKT